MPDGLEDVSKVPNVVAELLRRGWSEADVKSALGNNLLRVLREAETVGWRRTQTQVSGRKKKNQHFLQKHPHQYPSLSHREARHHTDLDILSFDQITDNALLTAFVSQFKFLNAHRVTSTQMDAYCGHTPILVGKNKGKEEKKKRTPEEKHIFWITFGLYYNLSACLRSVCAAS